MEVMKQWVEPEAVVEEVTEALQGRWRQPPHHDTSLTSNGSGSSSEDDEGGLDISFGFANNRGTTERYSSEGVEDLISKSKNSNIQTVISEIINGEETSENQLDDKSQRQFVMPLSKGGKEEDEVKSKLKLIKELLGEDEELIELEFERAVKHIDTHTTMYCPNCSSCITKVVVRKKRVVLKKTPTPPPTDPKTEPEILGCFSCFSLFIPSGDGIRLWPFGNGGKSGSTPTSHKQIPQPPADENVTSSVNGKVNMVKEGHCFSMFGIFADRKHTKGENEDTREKKKVGVEGEPDQTHCQKMINNGVDNGATTEPHRAEEQQKQPGDIRIDIIEGKGEKMPATEPPTDTVDDFKKQDYMASTIVTSLNPAAAENVEGDDPCPAEPKPLVLTPVVPCDEPLEIIQDSKSMEIVKSIVYGGLMELIASLSIVSSAAASGATTLNIITIGLANLIGGLVIIFHNLRDLKNDHSQIVSNRTNEQVERYQEVLGRRDHCLLHATVVVLSFLLFGLIPPVTYGFSFRTSDDMDLKLAVVAAASLLFIILLAIGKAYTCKPPRFFEYIKTIMYYVVTAIMVSGVSYAVGDLIERLVGNLGWFETSATVTLPFSEMKSINKALAWY
ncbi:hypothetical protein LguiB_030838 [Lonicera macranthoides]